MPGSPSSRASWLTARGESGVARSEVEDLLRLAPERRCGGFYVTWTRKEAFIKAQGDGFGYPLDRFDVSLAPGEAARLLRVGDESGVLCGWRMMSFSPAPGFVGAVVTEDKGGAHGC